MTNSFDAMPDFEFPIDDQPVEIAATPDDAETTAVAHRVEPAADPTEGKDLAAIVEWPNIGGSVVARTIAMEILVADPDIEATDSCLDIREVSERVDETDADDAEDRDDRTPYGHKAVELADELTRAVIAEDEAGVCAAREQLASELAALRRDFARWDAGLDELDTDMNFEAEGIVMDFDELDRPHLPAMFIEPRDLDDPYAPRILKPDTAPTDFDDTHGLFYWLNGLSNERLINYLQWSDYRTARVTEALQGQRETIEQNVRGDFDHLIEYGLAPESARIALEHGMEQTATFGALTALESGYLHCAGVYDGYDMRLGVRRDYEPTDAALYTRNAHDTFLHEELHGVDFANDMGLVSLQRADEEPLTWVDEAIKQHLTVVAQSGQADVLRPAERSSIAVYAEVRELLHLTLTAGDAEIDLRSVTDANFERRDAEGPYRQALVDQLRASYHERYPDLPPGETILHVIAKEYNAAPKPFKKDVIRGWIRKMYEWKGIEHTEVDDWAEPTQRSELQIVLGE